MIVKDEFLSTLRRFFDLNLYEVRIWTALLSRGVSTAGELSDIASVPRSRSYDVLESLEKRGFVVMKLGKPIKYIAVPPTEVVERVKRNMRQEADNKIKRLQNLKSSDVLKELEGLHTNGIELIDPAELSGSVKGRSNIHNHLDLTIKNAKESVHIMTTTNGLMRKVEGLKTTFEALNKKGVKIKIAAPMNKEARSILKEIKGLAEVRDVKDIKARFAVVDGKDLVFMVMDDDKVHPTYDTGIWVKTPFFAGAMENLFNMAWKDMKNVKF